MKSALREDQGIFKSGVVEVSVALTPLCRKTSRGDILCIGFISDTEVDVIFPGRRTQDTAHLLSLLQAKLQAATRRAVAARRPAPTPLSVRFSLAVEGTWRTGSVDVDTAKRRYQLLAARWTVSENSVRRVYGELPSD